MKTRMTIALVGITLCGAFIASAGAVMMPGAALSSGAETDTATGSVQNVGQAVIGRASNANVNGHFGVIHLLSQPSSSLEDCGDFDNDGDVDLGDFATFSLCFGGANNPPAVSCPVGVDADFDDDGDVDLSDFAELSLCYTGA